MYTTPTTEAKKAMVLLAAFSALCAIVTMFPTYVLEMHGIDATPFLTQITASFFGVGMISCWAGFCVQWERLNQLNEEGKR